MNIEFILFLAIIIFFMCLLVYLVERTIFPLVVLGIIVLVLSVLTSWKSRHEEQGGGPDREWDRDKPRV